MRGAGGIDVGISTRRLLQVPPCGNGDAMIARRALILEDSLIIAMEPGWAVAAAVVLAGQRFGLLQAAGAALVLAAIVGHELAPLKFKAQDNERIKA